MSEGRSTCCYCGAGCGVVTEPGPDAGRFHVSGQVLTRGCYVFNTLAGALVESNNCDTDSRLCMSAVAAAYKLVLGAGARPCSLEYIAAAADLHLPVLRGSDTVPFDATLHVQLWDGPVDMRATFANTPKASQHRATWCGRPRRRQRRGYAAFPLRISLPQAGSAGPRPSCPCGVGAATRLSTAPFTVPP